MLLCPSIMSIPPHALFISYIKYNSEKQLAQTGADVFRPFPNNTNT